MARLLRNTVGDNALDRHKRKIFKYNNAMHDVHEVTEADYVACNAKASIKHHISGSDAITSQVRPYLH
ncbi:hypothetical protein CUMW_165610 [Citrus unshiu]|uniref:Phytocyanin domain-containing protein n=1 Tax=Citrus unshiu TaxID=55188 RepID=A0A2H5PTF1_CITUN|nr:hypothetical protein CUMW_165610 [Citrus unshiu]